VVNAGNEDLLLDAFIKQMKFGLSKSAKFAF